MRNTQKNHWLRYGFAVTTAAFAGLAGALAACDDDVATTSKPDSGTTDSGGGGDTGTTAQDASKPLAKPLAKLTLVNATTDMGPNSVLNGRGDAAIRICFKAGKDADNLAVAPYAPLPDKKAASSPDGTPPGIFYGTGGTFPTFGSDLESAIVLPIIMNAKTLALKGIVNPGTGESGPTCNELVGAKADAGLGLVANQDYWELSPIPAETFVKGESFALVLTGCVGDATVTNKSKCGANPPDGSAPGKGNLEVRVFNTTREPVSPTQLGVQFLHASTQAAAVLGQFPIAPGFMADPRDAGSFKAATAAPATVLTLSPAIGLTGVTGAEYFVASKDSPAGVGAPLAPFPLATVQALSGLPAPSIFVDGKNFVFIAIGDPLQPTFSYPADGGGGDGGDGSRFNTRSFHYLAFPTDPTVVAYKP